MVEVLEKERQERMKHETGYSSKDNEDREDKGKKPRGGGSTPKTPPSPSSATPSSSSSTFVNPFKSTTTPVIKLDVKFELPMYCGELDVKNLDDWVQQVEVLILINGYWLVAGAVDVDAYGSDRMMHMFNNIVVVLIAVINQVYRWTYDTRQLPAYAFIAQDFTTQAALYTHHQYIAGFIMTGAFAHGAIFLIRDYNPEQNKDNVLARMLEHKEAIISHLSWVSLFLGFHTLGLYVHNDVMLAFGTPEKQILIEPIFAQWIQSAHGKTLYGFDVLLSSANDPAFNAGKSLWLPGWLSAINDNKNSLFLTIGPGDFLVHHAIALGLHTTTLILVKGALDARGSKLMPDKKDFGYSFPCDGPGRGGTCDISAWDAFYLAVFWMLNTIGWVTFYWHWKHITLWQGNVAQFNESSTYLMGWLRDYLWLNSSQLINGYNPFGMNSLSVWAWMFLFGHLVWATGFMFLISWRGYWQELIETLAWAHERTPLANLVRWRDKPVALSIVQARLVG
ncbi:photosystem I P700 chlorophyll a apoprotein A2-like [Cryptomeria japonica]|uniref:photosystem I P700 chlorophyll a apoprotein A2-like n=1 Tax=Cryptomeria japonica TaxID=3369 RepID=UPI0027DA334C|nr:photosystem I P700 chlorophyll a apoprotein A2-like [Cryptomeria japonica]